MGSGSEGHSAAQAAGDLQGGTIRGQRPWRTPGSKASQRGEPRTGKQETWPQPGSKHGAGYSEEKRGREGSGPGPSYRAREEAAGLLHARPNRRETVLGVKRTTVLRKARGTRRWRAYQARAGEIISTMVRKRVRGSSQREVAAAGRPPRR